MQVVEKNELEATTLKEVGKLKLVVTKIGKLRTADIAGRGRLSRVCSGSGTLRLGNGSLALGLLGSEELILTVDIRVG